MKTGKTINELAAEVNEQRQLARAHLPSSAFVNPPNLLCMGVLPQGEETRHAPANLRFNSP